jgi:hypothetical protein
MAKAVTCTDENFECIVKVKTVIAPWVAAKDANMGWFSK